jgi:Mlc titration factor MtfA (ptsG expression regulator)/Tfp pilus assembly protein PilF
VFSWFKSRRRRRILSQPFPSEWIEYLDENVHHYAYLPADRQARLRERIQVFVAEKAWVDCGGLVIDDEVRVTVAGQACLLVLGLDDYYFDAVRSILVYPGPYAVPGQQRPDRLLVDEREPRSGEAWHRGPIVLSWEHVLAGGRDIDQGRNLVIHEFAHHLDDLEGGMDGTPPLTTQGDYQRWHQVTLEEYQRLAAAAQRGKVTLLEHYGATSRAEFFAVASECFFERPTALAQNHPALYDVLRTFYRQDPRTCFGGDPRGRPITDAAGRCLTPEEVAAARYEQSVRRCVRDMQLPADGPDALFATGVIHAQNGRHDLAVDSFTEALQLTPQDAEAHRFRAVSHLELGRLQEALADVEQSLRIDPDDVEAYRVRGRIAWTLNEHRQAIADFERVLAVDPQDADAYYRRGLAYEGSGEHAQALADFSKAIHHSPDRFDYYVARGNVHRQLGMFREADTDDEQATRLTPFPRGGRPWHAT